MDQSNSILDALMLQVEAESGRASQHPPNPPATIETVPSKGVDALQQETVQQVPKPDATNLADLDNAASNATLHTSHGGDMDVDSTGSAVHEQKDQAQGVDPDESAADAVNSHHAPSSPVKQSSPAGAGDQIRIAEDADCGMTGGLEHGETIPSESLQEAADTATVSALSGQPSSLPEASTVADLDAIPPEPAQNPETITEGAEWEVDSSPYQSSDSDSSSDTTSSDDDSDDDDDDADGDYAMLDPEEAARILMQGDGGSDDEGGRSKDKAEGAGLRTANERFEEVVPKPDIVVTEDMKIEELGNIEFVVESTVVIKAKTSGEYQVLETGSLICLQDRSVVGVVADLIGRVEEPRYTVRFTNDAAIAEAGVSTIGTTVFYVPQHSTFVFTQPLKGVKGSDASNFHDEEVGDDEIEFSDDEAEAEHKRQLKNKRQGRAFESGRGRAGPKHSRGGGRGGRGAYHGPSMTSDSRSNETPEMNYDDVADGTDDGYTPLQRPDNLSEMLANGPPPLTHPLPPPPSTSRGDFNGRGRGHSRGGGGSHRPHRGRGGFSQGTPSTWNNPNNNSYQKNTAAGYSQHNGGMNTAPQLNLPNTPSIAPHNVTYSPMSPSPITPLPNASFNFGGFQPPPSFAYPQPQQPYPFSHSTIPGLSVPHMQNFQQQQHYQPSQPGYPPQSPGPNTHAAPAPPHLQPSSWTNNSAFMAEFQRQVEEQRRKYGQNQQ